MTANPHDYLPGTANWNRVAASQGVAAAQAQLQAVIDAERNGTPLDASTLDIFGDEIYNAPFQAPIEQASKIIDNAIKSAGDAAKNAAKAAAGNWGIWIMGAVIVIGLLFYFGFGKVIRRKLS
jgi:hypothetical protein